MRRFGIVTLLVILIDCQAFSQICELYPTRTSSVSYAVQQFNLLNCYSEVRTNSLNHYPCDVPFKAGFYLSTDTTISPSDFLVADYAVPCMNSGSCGTYGSSNTSELLKPISVTGIDLNNQNVPNGEYYVGVFLDREWVVTEYLRANNGGFFRHPNGYPIIIKHRRSDVGMNRWAFESDLEKTYLNNELLISCHSGDQITAELFAVDGKLLFKAEGNSITIPQQEQALYFLKLSNLKGSMTEKYLPR